MAITADRARQVNNNHIRNNWDAIVFAVSIKYR